MFKFLKNNKAAIVAVLSVALNLLGGSGVVKPVDVLVAAASALGAAK